MIDIWICHQVLLLINQLLDRRNEPQMHILFHTGIVLQGPVPGLSPPPPPCFQILRIDWEWVIDDVIMQGTWRHLLGKKTREKYVVLIVTFDLIGLLPTNHIIVNNIWNKLLILQWHTGVCEEPFNVNRKIAQTTQNIWNCIVRESNLQELANFGDYPGDFSNLETGRNGLKSGVSRIIRESWQPYCSWKAD